MKSWGDWKTKTSRRTGTKIEDKYPK